MSSHVATRQFAMVPAEIIFADISRSAKTVWSAMALNASPTKRNVWVNATSLGRKMHCTGRYIRMCIDELEGAGYLSRTNKKYKGRFRYYRLFQGNAAKPVENYTSDKKPAAEKKVENSVKAAKADNIHSEPCAHGPLPFSKPRSLKGIVATLPKPNTEVSQASTKPKPTIESQMTSENGNQGTEKPNTDFPEETAKISETPKQPKNQVETSKQKSDYYDIPMPDYMKRQIEEMHKSGERGVIMKAYKLYQDYRAEVRASRKEMAT